MRGFKQGSTSTYVLVSVSSSYQSLTHKLGPRSDSKNRDSLVLFAPKAFIRFLANQNTWSCRRKEPYGMIELLILQL